MAQKVSSETVQNRINQVCTNIQTELSSLIALAKETKIAEKELTADQLLVIESDQEFCTQMAVSEIFRSIGHWINSFQKNKAHEQVQQENQE